MSQADAEDALALAEAILDYLYVFSAQFDAFKERRRKGKTVRLKKGRTTRMLSPTMGIPTSHPFDG